MNSYIRDLLIGHQKKPDNFDTDSPVWPYLAYYLVHARESLASVESISAAERTIILRAFLSNLSTRAIHLAKNVLLSERDLLETTHNCPKINNRDYFELVRNSNEYLCDMLQGYPELDRLLTELAKNFAANTVEFARRFSTDRIDISRLLPKQEIAPQLEACEIASSETHNKSRVVVTVRFKEGLVVYKPRPMDLEKFMVDLLDNLISQAGEPYAGWRLPNLIVKDGYGWSEHIPHLSVETQEEVERFYVRMGFLLGFCTFFGCSDITADNVIASGASPVPVDLETSFYNVLCADYIPKEVRWNATQTYILPTWTWKGLDGIGIDLSALGGVQPQYVSMNLYQELDDGQGRSSFGEDGVEILPTLNVLRLGDHIQKPWIFSSEIVEGFETFAQLVVSGRDEVLGKIKGASGLRARYVPRATAVYHYTIEQSLHPSLMTANEKRSDFIRALLKKQIMYASGLEEAEVQACLNADVPFTLCECGTLDLVDPSYGGHGALSETEFLNGLEHVHDYILKFDNNRLAFEKKMIRNSLLAMQNMYEFGDSLDAHRFRQNDPIVDEIDIASVRQLVSNAMENNIRFLEEYLTDEYEGGGAWLGFHASPGGYFEYSEIGLDFYYGISGIAYALSLMPSANRPAQHLADFVVDSYYETALRQFQNPGLKLGGFYCGISSGIIPVYLAMAVSDERRGTLVDEYLAYVSAHFKHLDWEESFWESDLLSGACGTLCTLVKLFELTRDSRCAELSGYLMESILAKLVDVRSGSVLTVSRSITKHHDSVLSGLSHGVMGCAYALQYFNNVVASGSANVASSIERLTQWEISQFDGSMYNWPDYRKRSTSETGEFAWSHGAPGNLLLLEYLKRSGSELAFDFLERYPSASFFQEASLDFRRRPVNDSLCHGAYGLFSIHKQCSGGSPSSYFLQWANILNLSEADTRPLRVRAADSVGFWVGKSGSILGAQSFLDENFKVPLLPHEM